MAKRKIGRKKQNNTFIQFVTMTLICAVLASGIAYGWQAIEDKNSLKQEEPYSPSKQSSIEAAKKKKEELEKQQSISSTSSNSSSSVSSSSDISSSGSSSQDVSSSEAVNINQGLVEKTERVRSNYFNDAVFIGDSITTGLSLFDILPDSTIYASVGLNVQSVMTSKVIAVDSDDDGKMDEEKISVFDALKLSKDVNKIYVMLGANGLSSLGSEQTVKYYGIFIDALKETYPDAIIYIQSIFPVDEEKFAKQYTALKNSTIDETNKLLLDLANEKSVYFVNPAEVLKDENGGLFSEITPDGLHLNAEYYSKWIDYLKEHAITQK